MQYQFDVTIAERYSLEEAVFLHRIYHWVKHNEANERNCYEGKYWTHDSVSALAKIFPFWTPRQIQRIVNKCKEDGLLLTQQLSDDPRDRTLWYTVTETVDCIYTNGGMQYQFDVTIAERYSLEEAVFLHRIYHWVRHNEANERNCYDGKYWTHDSVSALAKIFSFWTSRQIQRIVTKCKGDDLLLTQQLSDDPRDRTLWYTVTETVKCIYSNGEMNDTKRCNSFNQTVKCIIGTNKRPNKRHSEKSESAPVKNAYGEFGNVKLTDTELDKLTARWTPNQVSQEIEALSAYMRSKSKRYADHYATLLNWLRRDFPPTGKTKLIEEEWANG